MDQEDKPKLFTDIRDILYLWIQNDGATKTNGLVSGDRVLYTIQNASQEKGGWEGWAQVEIAHFIKSSYPNLRVTREDGVYDGNTKRSDLVLQNGSGIRTIIELKCERGNVSSPKWIVDEVIKDAEKLQKTLRDEFLPAIYYAVGIAATKGADKEIQSALDTGKIPRTGFYCKNSKIYVFWAESQVA
ncbi:hypothetical protein CPAR01_11998 [Colletotrichum paranaense]|uniref:Restriction endonuclease n=1 Tax=Colletotrichum paranaense TaxID=1914294 RepID=A0ABQ9S8R0_9PEZI|nr:uncharacterized protein CPAR01_11998 [Colletotrichum paranaense]KAK1529686.1 hypothetical protein CPAR01_11998 [Colletotrichum paranaense]